MASPVKVIERVKLAVNCVDKDCQIIDCKNCARMSSIPTHSASRRGLRGSSMMASGHEALDRCAHLVRW